MPDCAEGSEAGSQQIFAQATMYTKLHGELQGLRTRATKVWEGFEAASTWSFNMQVAILNMPVKADCVFTLGSKMTDGEHAC